ncbi:MAG: YhjD/YihY/BrkB family envelope integrity protein, partial [bacterium]
MKEKIKEKTKALATLIAYYVSDYRKYVNSYASAALTFYIIILIVPAISILALTASAFGIDLSAVQNVIREFMSNEYTEMFIGVLTTSKISIGSLIVIIISVYAVSRGVGNIYVISKDLFPSEDYREEENIIGYYLYTFRITIFILAAFIAIIFMLILGPVGRAVNIFYGYLILRYAIMVFLVVWFFTMLYQMIPNVRVRTKDAFRGALIALLGMFILWVVTTVYFSFANFSNVYGPLASIVMVFFVLNWGSEVFYIGFYVAHLYYMEHQEKRVQEVVIERMTHFGDGVATVFGKPCYLRNVFTGEKVEVVVTREGRRRTEGFVSQVITPSVVRDDPLCTQADNCRLCQLQYMNYFSQITHKRSEIVRSLKRYTKFPYTEDVVWPVMPANEITAYRQYVSYPIYAYEEDTYIGHIDDTLCTFMADCQMQDDMIREAMVEIQELIHVHHVKAYNPKTKKGLRHIIGKKIDTVMIIIFVTGT